MKLSDLNPQTRILGAAIGIALWLAPAGAVWLYLKGQQASVAEAAAAKARQECAETRAYNLANAIRAATEEWRENQDAITEQAGKDAAQIAADLSAAKRNATRLARDLAQYAQAHPLPTGCRADADRVRLYNRARAAEAPVP